MVALKDILYKVTLNAVTGSTSVMVDAIEFDSRKVSTDGLYSWQLKEPCQMVMIIFRKRLNKVQ